MDRRLKSMSLPGGQDIGFEYDEAGRILKEVTPRGEYTHEYDPGRYR